MNILNLVAVINGNTGKNIYVKPIRSSMPQSPINKSGKKSVICGNRVIKISTKKLIPKYGKFALLTFSKGTFPIPDATNKQTPNGGVVKPMIKFSNAIMAK